MPFSWWGISESPLDPPYASRRVVAHTLSESEHHGIEDIKGNREDCSSVRCTIDVVTVAPRCNTFQRGMSNLLSDMRSAIVICLIGGIQCQVNAALPFSNITQKRLSRGTIGRMTCIALQIGICYGTNAHIIAQMIALVGHDACKRIRELSIGDNKRSSSGMINSPEARLIPLELGNSTLPAYLT